MTRLSRAADCDGVDGGDIPVAIAVVLVTASIPRGPDKDGALPVSASGDAIFKGPGGELSWTIHCLPVVIRSP